MKENWETALRSILDSEGYRDGKRGWMNDPADNGGPTLAGITYNNFCEFKGYPTAKGRAWNPQIVDELKGISAEDIGKFYHQAKWAPIHGDDLPGGIDLAVADVCVLHGPGKAREFLRTALGMPPKGPIDEIVVQAARVHPNWCDVVHSIASQRRAHYDRIIAHNPSQNKWRKGWYNRTVRVEDQCTALAAQAQADAQEDQAETHTCRHPARIHRSWMVDERGQLSTRG